MSDFINNYKQVILDNGLIVLFYQIREIQSVYITCTVRSGNDYIEDISDIGAPHFLEHLSFVSTEKYKTRKAVNQAIDNIGAYVNANTDVLGTQYWIKTPYINAFKSIDILYQLIFKTETAGKDIEKEKKIVLSEYGNSRISETSVFRSKIQENRFKNLLQYSFPAVGKPEQINSFRSNRLLDLRKKFYNPNNMILSVVGNFDEEETTDEIKKTFGTERSGKKFGFVKHPDNKKYSDRLVYVQNSSSDQIWFEINWPVFGWREVRKHREMVLKVMNNILGLGPSSKLNLTLRESEGLTYSCRSGVTLFPYLGTVSIYGSCDKDKLSRTFKKINTIVDSMKKGRITEAELVRTKKSMALRDYMKFESSESISKYLVGELFDYNVIWRVDDYTKEMEKVSITDIKNLTNKIFTSERININLLGNINQAQGEKLAKLFN